MYGGNVKMADTCTSLDVSASFGHGFFITKSEEEGVGRSLCPAHGDLGCTACEMTASGCFAAMNIY